MWFSSLYSQSTKSGGNTLPYGRCIMALRKKIITVVLTLLVLGELIESMGFGKFNNMFPPKEEDKKCFRRKNAKDRDGKVPRKFTEQVMTSSQEPQSMYTSSDEYTSLGVQETTSEASSPVVLTEPITVPRKFTEQVITSFQEPPTSASSDESARSVGVQETTSEAASPLVLTGPITGVWKWYNVSTNYTNWGDGQPSNNGGEENCVEINKDENDHVYWNDISCSRKFWFICEKGFL